ncbi:hypothetical protein KUH03_22805 [Sphingobacterium sp. E70]|uniref:hypothetical protein n=1 Tax=Sphingobacterium sp. E70 TaxID=2853439 RepID=UPI00211C07B0|nr:hypothetical protein [Sphingobacterium sp. E70]ULT22280.1 hypothetical protein KUH03_22805 [Sphingobacterium sp. E70]
MKNAEDILALLKSTHPFKVLPETVQISLIELMYPHRFTKDTLVYRQNITDMEGVDLIQKGEYETFFLDSSDNKRLIEIHHTPYCFGGISVLLNRTKALKSVIAKKERSFIGYHGRILLNSAMPMKNSFNSLPIPLENGC